MEGIISVRNYPMNNYRKACITALSSGFAKDIMKILCAVQMFSDGIPGEGVLASYAKVEYSAQLRMTAGISVALPGEEPQVSEEQDYLLVWVSEDRIKVIRPNIFQHTDFQQSPENYQVVIEDFFPVDTTIEQPIFEALLKDWLASTFYRTM